MLLVIVAALAINDQEQAEKNAFISGSDKPLKESPEGNLEAPAEINDSVSAQVAQTGDIDQIVNAIIADQAQDMEAAQADDADLQTLEQDSSLINPNDIYNANEF